MEKKRDGDKQEAKLARLVASGSGDARARVEEDLTRVQEALAAAEESRCKTEADTARLKVERTSLLLELRATKDEVSSLYSQASRDKEAMEEEYQEALEVIFDYGYGCSNTTSMETIQRSLKVCLTQPTRCLLSFL